MHIKSYTKGNLFLLAKALLTYNHKILVKSSRLHHRLTQISLQNKNNPWNEKITKVNGVAFKATIEADLVQNSLKTPAKTANKSNKIKITPNDFGRLNTGQNKS